jgi:aminopeptidase
MGSEGTDFFRRYAEMAVRVGANVQPGQRFVAIGSVEHVPLLRALGDAAWEAGAADAQLVYLDAYEHYLLARYGSEDVLERTSVVHRAVKEAAFEVEGASVYVAGDRAPAFFAEVDEARLARAQPRDGAALAHRLINEKREAWSVVAYPDAGWAAKAGVTVERLIDEITASCRLDEPDPVQSWREHLTALAERAEALNRLNIDSIRIHGGGSDLRVGLLPGSRWRTSLTRTAWGQTHCVNLPTEEVFTTPDFRRTEGTIRATRPFIASGVVIQDAALRFENGRVVEATASSGQESLVEQLSFDDGASALGELALVAGSLIGSRNFLFHHILFDENAASHIAYGMGYTSAVEGADRLTNKELRPAGINDSAVHQDFNVGGEGVDIDAVLHDGTPVPIISGDTWL